MPETPNAPDTADEMIAKIVYSICDTVEAVHPEPAPNSAILLGLNQALEQEVGPYAFIALVGNAIKTGRIKHGYIPHTLVVSG